MRNEKPPILDYADGDAGRLVTIASFRDEAAAHMAAALLESEEIDSVVGDTVSTAGARRPATLRVLADDVKAAIAILETTPARGNLLPLNSK
jgi:hypothetical protein